MTEFTPFHSAVNRIPVLRASARKLASRGALPSDLFSDRCAAGHDHLEPECWSGAIDLEMIVRSPLVFGEQTTTGEGRDERHFVDLPLDGDGKLVMSPTMVKGMISRAFETLTCSRFRVFGDMENRTSRRRTKNDHSERLTYRAYVASALRLIPVRVVEVNQEDSGLVVELLRGDTTVNDPNYDDGYSRRPFPVMLAASLQDGPRGHARFVPGFDERRLIAMTQHGREIVCDLKLCLHPQGGHYAYWQVVNLYNDQGRRVRVFDVRPNIEVVATLEEVVGYVYRTASPGDRAKHVFPMKHDERVFFDISDNPERLKVCSEVVKTYERIVASYAEQRELNVLQEGMRPNRFAGLGLKSLLRIGSLAYAVLSEDGSSVEELVPTMIGRRVYRMSPRDLATAQDVLPLAGKVQASVADRIFGYVVPSAEDNAVGGDVASRGNISFGVVDAAEAEVKVVTKPKLLTPLLAPKPTSARRFLTDAAGKTPKRGDGTPLARREYFGRGQLLGSASYPVHRRVLSDDSRQVQPVDIDHDGFPEQATRAPSLGGRKQRNTAVRLKVRSWLAAGSVLRCTMSFTNLNAAELGALIWVLTPENLVPLQERKDDPNAVGYLRMGLGKSVGLGALEVRIVEGGLRVVRGGDLAADYENVRGCMGVFPAAVDPNKFPLPYESNLLKTPWVQAMQRAAFGYSDGRTVRHMTLDENGANNREDSDSGAPRNGCGQAPTDLSGGASQNPLHVMR